MNEISKATFDYWMHPEEKEILSIVVMGHLVIESLLVESIKTQLKFPDEFDPYSLSFPKKVELCVAQDILSPSQKAVYLKLNTIRNKFAHQLNYDFTFDEAFNYAKEMAIAGFDFSDTTIHTNKESAREMYGIQLTLFEIMAHLEIRLIIYLHDHGVEIPQ
jgi:hypothetical protein